MTPVLLLALLGTAPTPDVPAPSSGASISSDPVRPNEAPPSLEAVLRALGADELRKEAASDCTFRERTRVEELADNGAVKGSAIRTWDMTRSKGVTTRKLLSSEKQGEINSMLTQDPKAPTAEERKAQRSPFHPEVQAQYRFKLLSADSKALELSFEPITRSDKRLRGTVKVDAVKHVLTSLTGTPSKLPPMVERLEFTMRLAPTGCGVQPVHIGVNGIGGVLFFKTRFRSATTHEGHAAPTR